LIKFRRRRVKENTLIVKPLSSLMTEAESPAEKLEGDLKLLKLSEEEN